MLDRLPDSAATTEVRIHAWNNLGCAEATAGDPLRGNELLTASLEQAQASDLHEHAARAYCNLGATAVVRHQFRQAREYLDAGREYCLERDLDAWSGYILGWHAHLLLEQGDSAAAHAHAEEALRRSVTTPVARIVPLTVLALARARQGRGEEEVSDLAQAGERVPELARAGAAEVPGPLGLDLGLGQPGDGDLSAAEWETPSRPRSHNCPAPGSSSSKPGRRLPSGPDERLAPGS